MLTQKQGQATERSSVLSSFRSGLFGALYVISKQHVGSKASSFAELFIKLAQLLSFVLAEETGFQWVKQSMSGLKIAVGLTTVNGYAEWFNGAAFLALFYGSLVWVGVFVSLFAWATWSFARGSFAALWPLKLLRAIGSTSATLLYIPMLTLLLAGFRCESEAVLYQGDKSDMSWWKSSGYSCGSAGWSVQVAITAIFLITFIALCLLWAACVQDRNILSTNLSAKSHGRMDFFFVCAKTLLVCMIKGWPQEIPPYAHIGVLIAVSCVWLAFSTIAQPYLHHVMNKANAAAAAVLLSSCICLAIGQSYFRIDAAIAWYACLPFAALAGAGLVDARAQYLATCPQESLSSATDVELRTRFMLHEVLYGHATAVLPIPQRGVVVHTASSGPAATAKLDDDAGIAEDDVAADLQALSQDDDVDARGTIVRRIMARAASSASSGHGTDPVRLISRQFTEGLARYRYSPLLHIAASAFHATVSGNRHLQMSHLLQAERKGPGLDLQYYIFATRRIMEEKAGNGGSKHGASALARVAFEKYTADARKAVSACLSAQSQFWAEMSSTRPGLGQLHALAERISSAMQQANSAFAELAKINAHSLSIIRLQAEYTLYALNDPDRAALLVAEAERVEEAQNKELRAAQGRRLKPMEVSTVDVLSESAGLVVVSAAPGNLGTILSASPAACRMFGYPKWQLERRSADILVPQPIAEWHTLSLRRFLATGTGRAVDATRMVLGQHKSGFVFPMLMTVRESAASDGPPSLIALMQPMASDDDFLMMDQNMAICAASQRSMAAFGLSTSGLTAREINLKTLAPALMDQMEALTSDAGAIIEIDAAGKSTAEEAEAEVDRATNVDDDTIVKPGLTANLRAPVSRRRSILAGKNADAGTSSTARTKLTRAADKRVYIKAWLQFHSSLTGHSFYSMVWSPVTAGGPAVPGVRSLPALKPSTSSSTYQQPSGDGSRTASPAVLMESRKDTGRGVGMGGPFISGPMDRSLTLDRPLGHPSPAVLGATRVSSVPTAEKPGAIGFQRSFSRHVLGASEEESHSSVSPDAVGLAVEGSTALPVPMLDLPKLKTLSPPSHAAVDTGGSRRESFDNLQVPKSARDTARRGSQPSARAGDVAQRLGQLRANAAAALSPMVGSVTARAMKRSAWQSDEQAGAPAKESTGSSGAEGYSTRTPNPAGSKDGNRNDASSMSPAEHDGSSGSNPESRRHAFSAMRPTSAKGLKKAKSSTQMQRRSSLRAGEDRVDKKASKVISFRSPRDLSDSADDDVRPATPPSDVMGGDKFAEDTKGDGGANGDKGSYASSRASTHNKRLMGKLRKVVDDSYNQPLIPQLRLLRIVALSVSIVAAAVAIGLNFYAASNLASISAGAQVTFLTGSLCDAVFYGTQTITTVVYDNLGLSPVHPTMTSADFVERERQLAARNFKLATSRAQELFDRLNAVSSTFSDKFLQPSFNYVRVSSNGLTDSIVLNTEQSSIYDGLTEYSLAMLRLASQNVSNIVASNPDFQVLANNGNPGQEFTEELNSTSSRAVAALTNDARAVSSIIDLVFTIILCVLGAACLTILLPAVVSLDAARDKLLISIMVLPPIILNTMRAQSEQFVAAFQSGDDVDEEDGASQGSASESIDMEDDNPSKLKDDDGAALLPVSEDGEYEWDIVSMQGRVLNKQLQAEATASAREDSMASNSSSVCGGIACCRRKQQSTSAMPAKEGQKKSKSGNPAWAKQSPNRSATKSPLLIIKLLLLFNSPLVFLFILLGVSMTQTGYNLNVGVRATHLVVASQYRLANLRAAYIAVRRSIRRFVTAEEVALDLEEARALVAGVDYWSTILLNRPVLPLSAVAGLPSTDTQRRVQGLLRGAIFEGVSEQKASAISRMNSGAGLCAELYQQGVADVTVFPTVADCQSWPQNTGSALAGLGRVENDWSRALLLLADRRGQSNCTGPTSGMSTLPNGSTRPYSPAAEFASDTMAITFMATTGILAPAYDLQTRLLQEATMQRFTSFSNFQTALLASCLVLYAVLVTVVYVLLVPRINAQLLKQRALLLLLPVQIFDHPTASGLKEIMNHALASSGIALGKGGRSGASSAGSVSRNSMR